MAKGKEAVQDGVPLGTSGRASCEARQHIRVANPKTPELAAKTHHR